MGTARPDADFKYVEDRNPIHCGIDSIDSIDSIGSIGSIGLDVSAKERNGGNH